ncbi:Adaptive-response sensory-kinase SasA [Caprobacter fermentans]|uniref:histidine kinase n=1 Tax=Caproicibacter fermentans TaxID=2576756 RepID=A0A6N8I3H7_9FIRM|nr:sensor histidine kinase [Caproicibacter fermentans]MVB12063.1 Adaptive-response sensory-kinase SasA [Caproicibacter fermentans]
MRYVDYVKDQIPCILTHIISMLGCLAFLSAARVNNGIIEILIAVWFLVAFVYLNTRYFFRNRYFKRLLSMLDHLDQKYLLSEVMDCPARADDQIYYAILKASNKSMLERVSQSGREKKEYREYIEQWIHDIKTPIAAMQLIYENNKSGLTKKLLIELEKIRNYTEQALYYARSDTVEKDYLVKEIVLSDAIHKAIAENKQLLLQSHAAVQMENCERIVYTDEKWISFIISQIISNAVKYSEEVPSLSFQAYSERSRVTLCIQDNGIGISESDLPRIFDKGFTGKNGRDSQNSTGIGLYLCNRLCEKLGIGITVTSKCGQGTSVGLDFPKGDFFEVRE